MVGDGGWLEVVVGGDGWVRGNSMKVMVVV